MIDLNDLIEDLSEQVIERPDLAVEAVMRLMAENTRLRWRVQQLELERDAAVSMLTDPIKEAT